MVITIIATTSPPRPRPRPLEDSSREEVLVPSRIAEKEEEEEGEKKESDIYDAVIISLPRSFAAPSIRLIATRGWK